MIDDIMLVFDGNIRRINHLLELYSTSVGGRGRKNANETEILRASVVLLHSTMEDYLRNLLKWKLPDCDKERLNEIALFGAVDSSRGKFQLGELLQFREMTVSEVIDRSIEAYLSRLSFNNLFDISRGLRDVGVELDANVKNKLFPRIDDMMKRRHHIVHQADRSEKVQSGVHTYKSLSIKQVREWKGAVDKFVLEINSQLINN